MKGKTFLLLLVCAIAVILLLYFVHVYAPSDGKVILYVVETGDTLEEPISYEEAVAIKKIIWGKIRWPEAIYGIPACGFVRSYAIILDGTRYMLSLDSCGTLCVEKASDENTCFYIDISDADRAIVEKIINSRYPR